MSGAVLLLPTFAFTASTETSPYTDCVLKNWEMYSGVQINWGKTNLLPCLILLIKIHKIFTYVISSYYDNP
jgi:hypothetical protein